jgi:hypothetical protein
MRKRKAGRVGSKPTAAGKRAAAKDLSARQARKVVGGLLPAVRPAERAAPSQTNAPTESWGFHYGKVEY